MSKKVIGVTGGFCTGKTTVVDIFAAKGAKKIDADDISHRLLAEDAGIRQKVIDLFGDGILTDGMIDRKKLGKKVFSDRDKLDELCRVLHPAIIQRIKGEIEKSEDRTIVIDAPLLIEVGLQDMVDIVIVVTADHETQIRRAMNRGFSDKEAKGIIANQMPLSEKVKFADFTIDNSADDLEVTKEGVDKIWKKM